MKHSAAADRTVVDFGAHFYPRLHEVEMPDGKGTRELDTQIGGRMDDPDVVRREMDEAGVDAMVFTVNSFLGHDDAEAVAASNDALLECVREYEAFYGLGALPVGAGGDAAADELERVIDAGLQGGGLHETDVALTDPEMEPVLEVADRRGAPLFVHIPRLPSTEHRFNATFGRERAQQESICRAIHEGLYDRYPDLAVVWHHFGGNVASMMGRIHLQIDPDRWPAQDDVKPFAAFKETFEERVYLDTAGFFGYTAPIRIGLEELPASQILFGTDYPWEPRTSEELERFAQAVIEAGSNADASRILGENALEIMCNVD